MLEKMIKSLQSELALALMTRTGSTRVREFSANRCARIRIALEYLRNKGGKA